MRRQLAKPLPVLVVKEMQRHKKYLEQRMTRLRREVVRLIACDPELDRRFRLMLTTIGIAQTSAPQILGELAVLPDMLDARASGWPSADWIRGSSSRGHRSGSGRELVGVAVVTCVVLSTCWPWSHCVGIPYLRVFYQNLLASAKARLQAVGAVMRKPS